MRPPTPIPAHRLAELEGFMKKKWPGNEFQRFLCVWLRVRQGMSTAAIANALGLHVKTVRFTQKDFIDNGVSALIELKRGGRKHCLMSLDEESAFLSQFEQEGSQGGILVVGKIKSGLEQHLGRPVHKTTIYRMLHRHGWRKLVPRPNHPKRNEEAAEAFKKGASHKG